MSLAAKIAALLDTLSVRDLESMAPAARRRLADRCRYVASLAERSEPVDRSPRAGVLSALRSRERGE